ncbi:MAG: response regulator, partial [Chloroflexi bacterium]|nr:response regulator [Chloroflexota bacterium]
AAGAQAVGSGDLGHRIEIHSNDEIGTLAHSFNQMAKDLDTTQKRMVEAERAAALQTFTEAKVEQLKQLSRLGLLITTESSMEGLVEKTPVMAKDITGASLAALVVFSENDSDVEHVSHTETTDPASVEQMLRDPVFLQPIVQGHSVNYEPHAIGQYSDQPAIHQYQRLKNILAVPLYTETGDVAGAIIIINSDDDTNFAQEDQELLQIIAGYISAAIQKLRKEDGLQRSEQKALNAVEELRLAQQQLIQAQKMESIGNLAGGVAHDFNNLLTPIMGYAQLGMMALSPGQEKLRSSLLEIQNAAERASNLTRQLLAFSRRQIIEPKVIDLNTLVLNMEKMLRRLIGEDIEFSTIPASHLRSVKVDPGQIEQVLMNLVVNARDAIPIGGSIKIETANVTLDLEYSRSHPEVAPGEYVSLGVSDNGTGIPDDVMEHIFEPFFTTKEEGKGTGLGLATCYGIAKQNGGHIAVYSELGQGATFKIYLPVVEEEAVNPSQRGTDEIDKLPRGTEMVLLVEDEDAVRGLAARVLKGQGYSILEASNGVEALNVVQKNENTKIDLLLTDVVMPLMGGRELADKLRAKRPGIKVLFTSGYTDEAIIRHGSLDPDTAFTQKPFSATDLALKVREVLEKPSADEQSILEQHV